MAWATFRAEMQQTKKEVFERQARMASIEAENAELHKATAILEQRLSTKTAVPKPAIDDARLDAIVHLYRQKTLWGLAPLSSNGHGLALSSSFIDAFSITPDEQARLNKSIEEAERKTNALRLSHAVVQPTKDGKILLTVASFPNEGGVVYDQLIQDFASTLGPTRNAAFSEICGDMMETSMNGFGATDESVTIAHNQDGTYSISQEIKLGNQGGTTNKSSGARQILEQLGPLAPLVPKDF